MLRTTVRALFTKFASTRILSATGAVSRQKGAFRRSIVTDTAAVTKGPPSNVGILAMDVYFPSTYVPQSELEAFDNVGKGKYTHGLGQTNMAFCDDREDINSFCLTAVANMMEKYKIPYDRIGRLEVGTETIIDKSKSIKTVLMTLFQKSGNTDVEGIDTTNACYGGTAALFNTINWVESRSWDGRLGIVVAADIAVYDKGPARPTGGAGAVVMLIGPNAPIVLEPGLRATHMEHAYDFYKPNLESEYPLVDGKLSVECYLRALDICYARYRNRYEQLVGGLFSLDRAADYVIFHSPYTKLVQKSYARMVFNDFIFRPNQPQFANPELAKFRDVLPEKTYFDRDLENAFLSLSADSYRHKVAPATLLPKELGNTYTASLYAGLLSLIIDKDDGELMDRRTLMFSYGSGLAASLFSVKFRSSLAHIRRTVELTQRLSKRIKVSPADYTKAMELREKTHNLADYTPTGSIDSLFPGTFYLTHTDKLHRRHYVRKH